MAHALSFRDAAEADAELILLVEQMAFNDHRDILDPPSSVFRDTVDHIRAKMHRGTFVLASVGVVVAGMVFYEPENGYMYLGRLSVLHPYRGRGIGGALVERAEERARAAGFTRVRLRVRVALPHLRARYERMGYRLIAEYSHAGYNQPTFIEMEKDF